MLQPQEERALTFFDVKGDVETVLEAFAARTLHYDRETAAYYHPGRSARAVLDGTPMAQFGQLHPAVAAARKLRQDVFLAEFDLDRLYELGLRQPQFKPLPRYPAVERDFSFLLPDAVVFEDLDRGVAGLRLAELRRFEPVEIFRGGNVAAGQYSILVRATFQSGERTLREEEVAQWSGRIIQAIEALGGTLRA